MGCASSKLDDLPAVALCRDRCSFLDAAVRRRYALADAHIAYIHSLASVGVSISDFVRRDFNPSAASPPSPKLKSGGGGGGGGGGGAVDSKAESHHLQFQSDDSDSDEDDDVSLHHSDGDSGDHFHHHNDHDEDFSPLHSPRGNYGGYMGGAAGQGGYFGQYGGGGLMSMNYMKNKATPSVVYQQRPYSPETVQYVGESSSSYNPYYMNPNPNNPPFPYYGYPNPGYYGGSPPQQQAAAASSSKAAPPPPSPPRYSPWDFLNVFQAQGDDKYYSQYTPSRDSREVRDEEGIPDLEDEYYQHEVVKEVHGHQKFAGDGGGSAVEEVVGHGKKGPEPEVSMFQTRPSVSVESERGVEYEVHVVDKKVVNDDDDRSKEAGFKGRGGSRDALDAVKEIEVQFKRASDSGTEIAQMLEAGKLPYSRKHGSKMLHIVTPSLSVVSKGGETSSSVEGPAQLDFEEELRTRSRSLSSTLQKLHLWEKKLYHEVKAEERMRLIHDRKCRRLKRLDEKGAEVHKVETTRIMIRGLSTKIRIAIQVVDKISVTINKIRDEELYPQLNELIQGLTRMYKGMLECHRIQCQAIREARGLGPIGSGKKLGDAHVEATFQFGRELMNWTYRFTNWITAQKEYVRALNNWLLKCLLYEPEETADGIVPFSPGRLGAPPIFVICHQWAQAMESISEKEVVDSMRMFAMNVIQIWEQDKQEMKQKMMVNKDQERKVRNMDREDQKMQKEIQAFDKKMVMVSGETNSLSLSGHVVYQSDTSNPSLQASLQRIFDAMEKFTSNTMKAYDDLLQRSEEVRVSSAQERVS